MPSVGRRRTKELQLPAGVRPIGARLFWQPTSARERDERKEKGLPASVPLGIAVRVRGRIVLTTSQGKAWADLAGVLDGEAADGSVGALLLQWKRSANGLPLKPNGKPRAAGTIKSYKATIPHVLERFKDARYGKTSIEASRGQAIGPADIQRFVATFPSKSIANIALAVLSNAFGHGIREGRTVYNPCEHVVKNGMYGRTRQFRPWEEEALRTLARPLVGLIMDFEGITGDRINEILAILRADLTPDGIDVHRKGGKVETWRWTPELRRIEREAAQLPGATPFAKSPLFPGRRGKAFTYSGFNTAWQALKAETNELLAAGITDPDTLELHAGLAIEDLHFHDGRSKVHDDAIDAGRDGAEQIGDTEQVARTNYARRPPQKTPLR